MLTFFDVSIKEKRVYGSLCFELLPQQMSQGKRSTWTCASMQIVQAGCVGDHNLND